MMRKRYISNNILTYIDVKEPFSKFSDLNNEGPEMNYTC